MIPIYIMEKARTDIQECFDWIAGRSATGAKRWYESLSQAIVRISINPAIYSILPESTPRWNRKIQQALIKTPYGRRYRILFELENARILNLRVRGPGQRPVRMRDLPRE